jgi:hypothetical protein
LLLSAFFLTQCALFSQVHKIRNQVSHRSSQTQFLLADGTEPPPSPTPLPSKN